MDKNDCFPMDLYNDIAGMGLPALFYPVEYGGSDADLLTCCLASEELCRVSASISAFLGSIHALFSSCFKLSVSKEQKKKYLPDVASGKKICAFALTEPDIGSDIVSMRSRAVRDDEGYVLQGVKNFNSGIDFADMTLVYAKTDPHAGIKGISAFIVEKGILGFNTG